MTININELNSRIPPLIRHIIGIKNRDYFDAAWQGIQDGRFDLSLECFNNSDLNKEPDYVGLTLSYPAGQKPTHILTRIFPISIGGVEMTRQAAIIKNDLISKIPAEA